METVANIRVLSRHGANQYAGYRLKQARQYLGYSLEDVAHHLNVDQSFIRGVESGSRGVDEATLMKFSDLYDRPYEWLTEVLQRWEKEDEES